MKSHPLPRDTHVCPFELFLCKILNENLHIHVYIHIFILYILMYDAFILCIELDCKIFGLPYIKKNFFLLFYCLVVCSLRQHIY